MSLQCLGHKFHTSKTLRFGSSWSRFSLFWRVSKCSRRIRSCWACSASAWKTTKFPVFRLKFLKSHVDAARKSKRWQKGRVTWRLFFSFGPSWLVTNLKFPAHSLEIWKKPGHFKWLKWPDNLGMLKNDKNHRHPRRNFDPLRFSSMCHCVSQHGPWSLGMWSNFHSIPIST